MSRVSSHNAYKNLSSRYAIKKNEFITCKNKMNCSSNCFVIKYSTIVGLSVLW